MKTIRTLKDERIDDTMGQIEIDDLGLGPDTPITVEADATCAADAIGARRELIPLRRVGWQEYDPRWRRDVTVGGTVFLHPRTLRVQLIPDSVGA